MSNPPIVGPRAGFVLSITASCPSIGSSTLAGSTGMPMGRDHSPWGVGDGRSWTLAGGKVGLFVCEDILATLPRPPDEPDEAWPWVEGLAEQEAVGTTKLLSWLVLLRVFRCGGVGRSFPSSCSN
jgi:hypothetical protein